jgi:hypothetical protein
VSSPANAYSAQYYQDNVNDAAMSSASQVIPFLIEQLAPKSMLELGAGAGNWSKAALEHGIPDVLAVDGAWVQPERLRVPPANFLSHDLATPLSLHRSFDLALCLEVGEHLADADADTLVNSLTRHATVVVFGAAMPMQGGTLHQNEQWPAYWQKKFRARGYTPIDIIRPTFWPNDKVAYYYKQNTFIYVKEDAASAALAAKFHSLAAANYQKSSAYVFIHPSKYMELGTFENVNVRLMLRKGPGLVARALCRKFLRNFSHDNS